MSGLVWENGKMSKLVVVESPYAGKTDEEIEKNISYARACMRDCFLRGEYPFASHLLYTQPGILDDGNSKERKLGIEAGLEWVKVAEATVVYTDLGITEGMKQGINRAEEDGRVVEYRKLNPNSQSNSKISHSQL